MSDVAVLQKKPVGNRHEQKKKVIGVRPASQAGWSHPESKTSGQLKRPQTQMSSLNSSRPLTRQSNKSNSLHPGRSVSRSSSRQSQQSAKSEISPTLNPVKEDEEADAETTTKAKPKKLDLSQYRRTIFCDFYLNKVPNNPVELKIMKGVDYRVLPQLLCKLQELASKKPDWNRYLPQGVHYIFDAKSKKEINNVDELKGGRLYVMSSYNGFEENVKYGQKK